MIDVIDSPIGPLTVTASSKGLTALSFGATNGERATLSEVRAQLEAYFASELTEFDLPIDISRPPFATAVSDQLRQIPYGQTISYAELARRCGSPQAVRAAGTACATNPLPIIIACHRVVRSDGGLGGYLGGLDAKQYLLGLESGRSSRDMPSS